jgi:general secretion pathway protein K
MNWPTRHPTKAAHRRYDPLHGPLQRKHALARALSGCNRQRGIALVLVLWLVVLITIIGSSHAHNARIELNLAFNHIGAAQARALAEAGIHRAIMELFVSDEDANWAFDGTAYRTQLDTGSVNVAIRDASGLLDLNRADAVSIDAVLEAAGTEESVRQRLVDAILDWRDKDKLRRLHGAEDDDYRRAGLDWEAADALFFSIDELRYVLGMTPELFDRLAPYLTVFSSSNSVNREFASAWLVKALTGSEPEAAAPRGAEVIHPSGPYHISAWATSNSGSHASVEVVLSIEQSGTNSYKILSWREPARPRILKPG